MTDAREVAAPLLLRHAPLFTLLAYSPYPEPARAAPGPGERPAAVTAAERREVAGLVRAGLAGLAGKAETACVYRPGPRGAGVWARDGAGKGGWRCGRLSEAVRERCTQAPRAGGGRGM